MDDTGATTAAAGGRASPADAASRGRGGEPGAATVQPAANATEPVLTGYLDKLGDRGIRTWRRRWFFFDRRACRLLYYKTPRDHAPLGFAACGRRRTLPGRPVSGVADRARCSSIAIANAKLTLESDREHCFTIGFAPMRGRVRAGGR